MNDENRVVRAIKKVGEVLEALTDLALKAGTLAVVIKLLLDTIQ